MYVCAQGVRRCICVHKVCVGVCVCKGVRRCMCVHKVCVGVCVCTRCS